MTTSSLPISRRLSPLTLLAGGGLLLGLAACAGDGGGLAALGGDNGGDRNHYTCQGGSFGGHFFDTRYRSSDQATILRMDGATSHPHTLNRVVDPNGTTVFQDAELQLRTGGPNGTVSLTDRNNGQASSCTRTP
ncbi:hypothetical protein [Rhizosaccharibacter radicis]|uniref:C-type lysozyme inhibitor domain-containing protein n=1 Tax=Rhizosaccharibacter radicis TaxID=2782605 RepID=A0ABT1VV27_9PROT|nr:hypothetical protein [Acetobacteraceae bacterium KSS12]